jgi:hypothetical protein
MTNDDDDEIGGRRDHRRRDHRRGHRRRRRRPQAWEITDDMITAADLAAVRGPRTDEDRERGRVIREAAAAFKQKFKQRG